MVGSFVDTIAITEGTAMDKIIRVTEKNGMLRGFAAETTCLAEEARNIHDTYPVVTAALGRMLTANAMMGITLKGEKETLSLQIKGSGPVGGIVTVSDSQANVRGYVENPKVDIPLKYAGKLNVGAAVGKGYLTVVKDLGMKEPYIGRVELQTGEIAEDIAYYFAASEQVPSIVALGVLVDKDWSVKASGGYMIQLMPGANEDVISRLEQNVAELPPVSALIQNGLSPEELLEKVLNGFQFSKAEEAIYPRYQCNCSRERIEKALISIGKKDLRQIMEEDGKAELGCHFCGKKYLFSREDLSELISKL